MNIGSNFFKTSRAYFSLLSEICIFNPDGRSQVPESSNGTPALCACCRLCSCLWRNNASGFARGFPPYRESTTWLPPNTKWKDVLQKLCTEYPYHSATRSVVFPRIGMMIKRADEAANSWICDCRLRAPFEGPRGTRQKTSGPLGLSVVGPPGGGVIFLAMTIRPHSIAQN